MAEMARLFSHVARALEELIAAINNDIQVTKEKLSLPENADRAKDNFFHHASS